MLELAPEETTGSTGGRILAVNRVRELWIFFVAVFVWTWGIAALMVLAPDWVEATFGEMSASQPLFVLAVYAPSLLGVVLTAVFEGRSGLGRLLARLNPLRIAWWWYPLIIVAMLALSAVCGVVAWWLGGSGPGFAGWSALGLALTVMFVVEPGPIGEELGWRGFALPRLLESFSPRSAGFILGVIWAVWHLPAFFISGTPQEALALPVFLVGAVALSVLATWLYVNTAGSVLASILLHRMANGANDLTETRFEAFAVGLTVVAVVLWFTRSLREPAPPPARIGDSSTTSTTGTTSESVS